MSEVAAHTEFELRACLWPTPWGEREALGLFPIQREAGEAQPTVVDFMSNAFLHRVRRGVGGETLIRATGIKESERANLRVIDATAGLGQDAALLAVAGFRVLMYERHPWLHALLADALKRVRDLQGDRPVALKKLEENLQLIEQPTDFLHPTDSKSLNDAGPVASADLVYLDPMFEDEALHGKADTKRDLSRLRHLLRGANDLRSGAELLAAAQARATRRVLVKRPSRAPHLVDEPRPHGQVEGKIARFDIYPGRATRLSF
ncbi:MAG TPA: class I SAM-dependent methyltransferase [Pseudobdellovibrionaceae bacterium]|nr:class I SAM-dependent methyltransferase [Pseudobdellovibrionaceae bacterium]